MTKISLDVAQYYVHSKLRNIMLCGNQSAYDIKEFCSVNMDVW